MNGTFLNAEDILRLADLKGSNEKKYWETLDKFAVVLRDLISVMAKLEMQK